MHETSQLPTDEPPRTIHNRVSYVSDLSMTENFPDEDSLIYSEEGHSVSRMDADELPPEEARKKQNRKHSPQAKTDRNSNLHHAMSSFRPRKDDRKSNNSRMIKFPKGSKESAALGVSRDEENQLPRQRNPSSKRQASASYGSKKDASRNRHQHHGSARYAEEGGVAGNWMTQLAYSFRSPSQRTRRNKHSRTPSASMQEYSPFSSEYADNALNILA